MEVLSGEGRNWSHRDGSVQKTLPLKHEDLSSDSQHTWKRWEVVGLAANASTGKFWGSPVAHWAASPAESVGSRFSTRPCLRS